MSTDAKGKNDLAWEALFQKYDILNQIQLHGRFVITANQIRVYREPRLMAKFDHMVNLPKIFQAHQLAILPISRGDYVIARFQAYQRFPAPETAVRQMHLPGYLQSLEGKNIINEATAINCAFASGILSDFLGEPDLSPAIWGRMGSNRFSFQICDTGTRQNMAVTVDSSQIEIDASFEGRSSFAVLEAKQDLSDDFLIRQLYYPFRTCCERVKKPVRPVFLVYSNGIYSLYEYRFREPTVYHSLELVRQKNYTVEDRTITREDLFDLWKRTSPEPETGPPFPQADRFARVINLCELLRAGPMSKEDVVARYDFVDRQADYYITAGVYLGLIQRERQPAQSACLLTEEGRQVMDLPYRMRQLELCRRILQHQMFHKALGLYFETGRLPDKRELIALRKVVSFPGLGAGTYKRRTSSIIGWLRWMTRLDQDSASFSEQLHFEM